MLKKIWEWIKERTGYQKESEEFEIEIKDAEDLIKTSITILRHLLASIDLSDARDQKEMTAEERKDYVARIAANFDVTNKIGKRLIIAQEEYISRVAENEKQLMFGRGTVNGIMIFHEELEEAFKEHMANIQPQKPFDRTKLFPDIKE